MLYFLRLGLIFLPIQVLKFGYNIVILIIVYNKTNFFVLVFDII